MLFSTPARSPFAWPSASPVAAFVWVAEADALTGPWALVSYWAGFGDQGYFLNAPSPFWAGRTGWLWYSANWFERSGLRPNPSFCRFAASAAPPFAGRGSCYGSVLGQIAYEPA